MFGEKVAKLSQDNQSVGEGQNHSRKEMQCDDNNDTSRATTCSEDVPCENGIQQSKHNSRNGVEGAGRHGARQKSDAVYHERDSRRGFRSPKGIGRYAEFSRRRSAERRAYEDRWSFDRERKASKHEVQKDIDYSEESISDDEKFLVSAESDSGEYGIDREMGEAQGWESGSARSKNEDMAYSEQRNRREDRKRASRRRHRRDQDFSNHSYHSAETNNGRPSQRRVCNQKQPENSRLLRQMLRCQTEMLGKLDTMVMLLRKTARALSAQRRWPPGDGLADENVPRVARKRSRWRMPDSDQERANYETLLSEKRPRHLWEGDSSTTRMDSYTRGDFVSPENTMRHRNETKPLNEELQPRISSYYSVRCEGIDTRQQDTSNLIEGYRAADATVMPQSSMNGVVDHRPNATFSNSQGEQFVVITPSAPGVQVLQKPVPISAAQGLQNDEAKNRRDNKPDVVQSGETEEMSRVGSSEFPIGRGSVEPQLSLKRDGRPSMVDLSQTNNTLISQKYYKSANGYAQSSNGASEVDGDGLYGDEDIYQGQHWKGEGDADGFKSPNSRKKEIMEPTPWLARTFTTGKGDGSSFSDNIKTESTDNKKMTSNINHLTLSTMCVSSEIVQVLVVTPSDQNNDKDAPRKSMERVLNQSLALMGCLPLIAEIDLSVVQKIYHGSKNCMSFIYRLMDHCYTREELMKCRVAGGVRKYRGNNTETEQLCPKRLRTILKLASDLYPNEYAPLTKANMIRNNINMKCRKTVIRDAPDSDVIVNHKVFQPPTPQ